MIFSFKIGEKIILKEDRTKAKILLLIGDKKVKIEDEEGFIYIINISEILPLDSETDNPSSYGSSFNLKAEDEDVSKVIKSRKKKFDSRGRVKIDLHIENLTNHHVHMQNSEIVKIQMDYCKIELDLALEKSKHSLEIIHGIGEGVLMEEVHKLLNLYNLKYYISNDSGSTEVIL